ncbi:triose-phosphate isomerase [Pseudoroseicyclus aestuarii]|uniref:Triosephosphate isomerase n=1 Tax=Pseudoroseicyclus aestuarii TaxID=1795041 RepID=A0A318T1K8_9RHOB|nr:triose-phosphate isomerase [Pseudoroseicyclus aestuarii]PYE85867.1 triosephosphate isomerase [Pseudoroseicyclus aestuarii]
MRQRLAVANWKMNGHLADVAQARAIADGAKDMTGADVLICPPATLIAEVARALEGTAALVGAQDCHAAAGGAHTGDLSAAMLREAGATHVILGHSERRAAYGESDAQVRAKAEGAWAAGLVTVLCVGEDEAVRDAGEAEAFVTAQVEGSVPDGAGPHNTVFAYEPVWAVGTGRSADAETIERMHGAIRRALLRRLGDAAEAIPLLYGGSVKAANAEALFALPQVDGALVGGASLKAEDFCPIIAALAAAPR